MFRDGKREDYTYRAEKAYTPVLAFQINGETIVIFRKDVKKYVADPDFSMALDCYQMTKLWGLANGGNGWVDEPCDYMEAITALELEARAIEREELEKNANNARKGRPSDSRTGR